MGMGIATLVLTEMEMARWEWEGVKTPRFPFWSTISREAYFLHTEY